MPLRPPAGFISAFYDPLKNPDAPTIGTATKGDTSASITFTAPANTGGGAITGYTVVSTPGSVIGTGASSPVTVSGLTNGTAYTFAVWALNTYGPGPFSAASGSVTPAAAIALWGGSYNSNTTNFSNVISQVIISTLGNSTDFGDLLSPTASMSAFASSSRGVFACGRTTGFTNKQNSLIKNYS